MVGGGEEINEDEAGECSEEEREDLGVGREVDELEVHVDEEELEGGGAVAVKVGSPAVASDGAAEVLENECDFGLELMHFGG